MTRTRKKWASRTTGRLDIEAAVAARLDMPQEQVGDVLCEALNEIATALAAGRRVELRRWGVFEPKELRAREFCNIATGTNGKVGARTTVKFKPAPALREIVSGEERAA
ncbi:MAG: HU family DNA-binding protein [Planctomycetota bacterium]